MEERQYHEGASIGALIKERNIVIRGADPVTARGFTQVPNFILASRELSGSAKLAFSMLLSYAWQNDYCFPGQETLAGDLGVTDRSIRSHLKELEAQGLLTIRRRGQGKTNIYELSLTSKGIRPDRKRFSVLDRNQSSALERKQTSGLSFKEYSEE